MNDVIVVPRDVIEAYESRTGFFGFGDFLVEQGAIKIVGEDNPHMFSQVGARGNAMGGKCMNCQTSLKEFPLGVV